LNILKTDKLAGPGWSDREPYRTLVSALEELETRGATADDLIDATLSVALTMASNAVGPRELSQRLYVIATRFAADADLANAAARGGADGVVH
jgi:hypothetical protein